MFCFHKSIQSILKLLFFLCMYSFIFISKCPIGLLLMKPKQMNNKENGKECE